MYAGFLSDLKANSPSVLVGKIAHDALPSRRLNPKTPRQRRPKQGLTVGNDANGDGGEAFAPNTYACRPPGAAHGPFKSEHGCVLLEIHYYDPV